MFNKASLQNNQASRSVDEFIQNPTTIINRLNRFSEPQILTVEGKATAILISPAVYEEAFDDIDCAVNVVNMRRAKKEIEEDIHWNLVFLRRIQRTHRDD